MNRRPGALVLLRHGESTANADDRFGGWLDFPLTARGRAQAATAGRVIRDAGLTPAAVHTSLLNRAIDTADIAAGVAVAGTVNVAHSWRLNERHYGRLQGRRRAAVREEVGDALLQRWRRSYDLAPPPIDDDDPAHPRRDSRYAGLDPTELPTTESLADVCHRLLPYWRAKIVADLTAGHTTLVVAHGNSLRALCMLLDGLSAEQIRTLHIPTAAPLRYDLDDGLRPRVRGGVYLDPERAAADVAAQVTG
jgi:2,3-bisphosphoglycerate-dependent phosphoglycerate mutase